jgi:hypothetical protein
MAQAYQQLGDQQPLNMNIGSLASIINNWNQNAQLHMGTHIHEKEIVEVARRVLQCDGSIPAQVKLWLDIFERVLPTRPNEPLPIPIFIWMQSSSSGELWKEIASFLLQNPSHTLAWEVFKTHIHKIFPMVKASQTVPPPEEGSQEHGGHPLSTGMTASDPGDTNHVLTRSTTPDLADIPLPTRSTASDHGEDNNSKDATPSRRWTSQADRTAPISWMEDRLPICN